MRVVTVHRWHIIAAFVAVTAASAVGLAALKVSLNRTDAAAREAKALAVTVKRQQAQINAANERRRKLRTRQIADLKRVDAHACAGRHIIDRAVAAIVDDAVSAAQSSQPFPGLTPAQQAELDRRQRQGLEHLLRYRALLRRADCHPPPKPKVPAG